LFTDDGQPGVLSWIDPLTGAPLGVPVVHFAYNRAGYRWGISALEPVIPLQNALNKAVIDLIAAADTTGFRIFTMLGSDAVDEDGEPLSISPGSFISLPAPPSMASIGFIPGEDLRPLVEVVDAFKISIAQVTETPLHLFQVSGQNASEGAQKQQEVGMISKASDTAIQFGNSWERCMQFARRLENAFGKGRMDEKQLIETVWKDFEIRNLEERAKARAEIFAILVGAGVDPQVAALRANYSKEEAAEMAKKMRALARDQVNPPMDRREGNVPAPAR
jgi:hypothetical protein